MLLDMLARSHQITLRLFCDSFVLFRNLLLFSPLLSLLTFLLLGQNLSAHFFELLHATLSCGLTLQLLAFDTLHVFFLLQLASFFVVCQLVAQV